MHFFARHLILIMLLPALASAQNPLCPGPLVYMDGPTYIRVYDPAQPLSSLNPSNTSIPSFGSGLALMQNINSDSICPTFYTTLSGIYYYWNGNKWVNTGHSTGSSSAVNLTGCDTKVYNLVGTNGDVYTYDGTGNGTYLTTIPGFNGGGPFDLSSDCNCNFYALKTTTTGAGQGLTMYSPTGSTLMTYSLVNMPHSVGGMGLAVTGNSVFVKNGTSGFYIGTISGSAVTFTHEPGFALFPGDFASCPSCSVTPQALPVQISSATLSCYQPTVSLAATTTVSPVTYSWSGPSISGSATGSAVSVSSPGTYTCLVTPLTCGYAPATIFTTVTSNTSAVTASVTPSGDICIAPNEQHTLSVSGHQNHEVVTWAGPGININTGTSTLAIQGQGSYTVTVTNTVNGCSYSEIVDFAETPTISVALSSTSICALPLNGSPAGLVINASGAQSYTLLPDAHFLVNAPHSPTMLVTAISNNLATAAGTIIGCNKFCYDTTRISFGIYPNPAVSVLSGNICPGESHTLTAIGAASYTWSGKAGGPDTSSTIVVAPLSTSVFTVIGSSQGCFSDTETATVTVKPAPGLAIAPSAQFICQGSSALLKVTGTADSFTWTPAATLSSSTGSQVTAAPASTQAYTVTGSLNGCVGSAAITVNVQIPPTLSVALSGQSFCYHSFNGSPNSITVTPSGATSYTLLPGSAAVLANPTGSALLMKPGGPAPSQLTAASATLLGNTGVCTVSKTFTFYVIPNPTITLFPASASVCPGGSQAVNVSGAAAYLWAPTAFPSTLSAGSATVKPSVTSILSVRGASLGCFSDLRKVVIHVNPLPQLSISAPSFTSCTGLPIQLSAPGTATDFTWSPAAVLSAVSGQSVIATPSASQQFTVVGSLNSCTSQAVATISVLPMPVINVAAQPSVVCKGGRITLSAQGAAGYSWTPSPWLESLSGEQVRAVPQTNSTFTVWGFNGVCSGSASVLVKTVEPPHVALVTKEDRHTICEGESLLLTATGGQTYSWLPSAEPLEHPAQDQALVKPARSVNISVSGANFTDGISCSQIVSFSVTVIPQAIPAITGSPAVCEGGKTILEASGGDTYVWKPVTGLSNPSSAVVEAQPAETTVYSVEASYNSYCGNSATVIVQVLPRPLVFAGNDTSWNLNDPIFISAIGTGSISWVSGENIACAECATTEVSPLRSGCYEARAINEQGCISTDQVCLQISEEFTLYMPNSFSPNGDGLNDRFKVHGENFTDVTLEIYDRWGHLLLLTHDGDAGWDGTSQGSDCKRGTYVYRLTFKGIDRKTYHRAGHVTLVR